MEYYTFSSWSRKSKRSRNQNFKSLKISKFGNIILNKSSVENNGGKIGKESRKIMKL